MSRGPCTCRLGHETSDEGACTLRGTCGGRLSSLATLFTFPGILVDPIATTPFEPSGPRANVPPDRPVNGPTHPETPPPRA
jgi:hypothetical protein